CGITRLAGCYVDGEKKKLETFNDNFYNFPEEEMFKYLEIFRKTLSGTPGKNLVDMAFAGAGDAAGAPGQDGTDAAADDGWAEPGGADAACGQALLESLRKSELNDDTLLNSFYDRVIETYNFVGNFLILVIYQSYDVPGVTSDGLALDDASEEIYRYILCSICPMKLTKPGLGFDAERGGIHLLRRAFAVDQPDIGFLFPAFNDRSADVDTVLFSSKKTDILQDIFLERLLGVSATLPAKQQKEGFTEFVADVLGDEAEIETVFAIQDNLRESIRNKKLEAEGEPVYFDKSSMRDVFERSGVSGEGLERFERKFDDQFDMQKVHRRQIEDRGGDEDFDMEESYVPRVRVEEKLFADNVAPTRSLEVRNQNMVLRVNSKHTDIIDTRIIDGRKCLVIEVTDDLTVNGIPVEG
ncbi:MAG: DUF4317 domain-containing protein, partial [Eubacterium sp.]|nr:DUF4317 domain-containing protein [Eubacterium sp.]